MPNYLNSEHVAVDTLPPAPMFHVDHHYEPAEHLSGLGGFLTDVWNSLTGKPQSWYTNVSSIQNQLSLVLAGVTAVGSDVWNFVSQQAQGPTQDGSTASGVDSYDTVVAAINAAMKAIIVTTSNVPADADIASAQATASNYQSQLTYVQSVAPDVAAQVQADQAQVQAMLPTAMTSPSVAGQQAFADELAARAAALGQGLLDFASLIPWILGGGIGLYLLWKFGGKS